MGAFLLGPGCSCSSGGTPPGSPYICQGEVVHVDPALTGRAYLTFGDGTTAGGPISIASASGGNLQFSGFVANPEHPAVPYHVLIGCNVVGAAPGITAGVTETGPYAWTQTLGYPAGWPDAFDFAVDRPFGNLSQTASIRFVFPSS